MASNVDTLARASRDPAMSRRMSLSRIASNFLSSSGFGLADSDESSDGFVRMGGRARARPAEEYLEEEDAMVAWGQEDQAVPEELTHLL